MGFRAAFKRYSENPAFSQPALALGFTGLSLLLLVLVLLSVPGPIKGLYWFSVNGEGTDQQMSVGVLGWCMSDTSNCTYSPLSDNSYLSSLIDTGLALTVHIALPISCYWMIVVLIAWVLLTVTVPMGYAIKDLDSISRHLRFVVVEATVLCVSLFGNVLCWLAFGLGRAAFMSASNRGANPQSGHAMETTAVAAMISLISLLFAGWGLHLRLQQAQHHWKEGAVMVRRRSMALVAAGLPPDAVASSAPDATASSLALQRAGSSASAEKRALAATGGSGWQEPPAPVYRNSIVKVVDPEETLDPALQREMELARRRDSQATIRRESMVSPHDAPYAPPVPPRT